MEKLKSSMKTFQESITSLNAIRPICLQEGRTLSFREIIQNNSVCASTSSMKCETNPLSSERFFFSPHKTKDIMEEHKSERKSLRKLGLSNKTKLSFSCESMMLAMESYNPYQDFRKSMEEMVEVHQLREWAQLQELLHCYLSLNDKKTHKVIVIAFVDLLMHMISRDNEGLYASLPLTFCLDML
jgi:uncharacterized protein (TIGR01568 family)